MSAELYGYTELTVNPSVESQDLFYHNMGEVKLIGKKLTSPLRFTLRHLCRKLSRMGFTFNSPSEMEINRNTRT